MDSESGSRKLAYSKGSRSLIGRDQQHRVTKGLVTLAKDALLPHGDQEERLVDGRVVVAGMGKRRRHHAKD